MVERWWRCVEIGFRGDCVSLRVSVDGRVVVIVVQVFDNLGWYLEGSEGSFGKN